MPRLTRYEQGNWNTTCDQCGRGFKFNQLALRWDGAWVCRETCWEPRQPQDFVKAVKDVQGVPIARPRVGIASNLVFWTNGTPYVNWLDLATMTWTN